MTETKAVYAVRRNKYNARKATVDGFTFDSQAEARRYGELKNLLLCYEIGGLEVHPSFVLMEKFRTRDGTHVRGIKYVADFSYYERILSRVGGSGYGVETWEEDAQRVVEDVKGKTAPLTGVFRLKWKLAQHKYPAIDWRIVRM